MKKILKFVTGLGCLTFLGAALVTIIKPIPEIIVIGIAGGVTGLLGICVLCFSDSSEEYWREVEDIDQQKIYEDE